MKKLGLLLSIMVLLLASVASAEMVNIALFSGENWVSVPLIPFNPAADTVFPTADGNLARFDAPNNGTLTFSSFFPEEFGGVLLGDGFTIGSGGGETVSYDGVPESYLSDVWISLPGNQTDGQDLGGEHWIGQPFNHETAFTALLVTDGTVTVDIATAVNNGWIDGVWNTFDASIPGMQNVGLPDFFPPEETLKAGRMYDFFTHKDNIALIVPAS